MGWFPGAKFPGAFVKGRDGRLGGGLAITAHMHNLLSIDQGQGEAGNPMPLHLIAHKGVNACHIKLIGR